MREAGATEARQMGAVMKAVHAKVAGRADGNDKAGDLDLLLGALAALAQAGLLLRFHREPGFGSWLALCGSSCLGWFAYPPLFALLLPLVLIYYLSIGARHHMAWHFALLAGLAAGVGPNFFWLIDWLKYWWIRVPLQLEEIKLSHRTFHTLWNAPLWAAPPIGRWR